MISTLLLPVTLVDKSNDSILPVWDVPDDLEHFLDVWIRWNCNSPVLIINYPSHEVALEKVLTE